MTCCFQRVTLKFMASRKFYKITEEEFVNIDLIVSVRLKEEEVLLSFLGGEERVYKMSELDTHFYNFIQIKLLL
jgi:hypothetical protein